jgi:ribose transport system permease protein
VSAVTTTQPVGDRTQAWRMLGDVQRRFPALQVAATLVVFGIGAITLNGLTSWEGMRQILVLAALTGLASLGQTLLILMGGFDLSIAGFIVASGLLTTQLRGSLHLAFVTSLLLALVIAGGFGAAAGYLCHRFTIQPLIVTLAIGTIAFGLAQTQASGGLTFGANAPDWLIRLCSASSDTFGIPIPPMLAIWVVVGVLMTAMLHRTVIGRRLMATGANMVGAEYSLVKTRRIWIGTFMFSGVVSALVGLLVTGFGGSITTTSGDQYLFLSVLAVLAGGTVFGGPGDYLRTMIGALFVTVVDVVLVGYGATMGDEQMIYGAAMLIAVSFYGRSRRLRDRV